MEYDFSGKVVLMPGGTGALGREVSLAFLKAKAFAIITYVLDDEVNQIKSKLGELEKNAILLKVDLTDSIQVQKLVSDVLKNTLVLTYLPMLQADTLEVKQLQN